MLVEIETNYGTGFYYVTKVSCHRHTLILDGYRNFSYDDHHVEDEKQERIDLNCIKSITFYGGRQCRDSSMRIIDPDMLQRFINYVNTIPLYFDYEFVGEIKLQKRKNQKS